MALITKYGSIWGQIPNTAGRVLWVAPTSPYLIEGRAYDRSDDNDGLSPERALSTINRATVLATANAGDVVVLLPGTHVLTAAVTASRAGITYMGLPSGAGNLMRQKTVVQATASTACFAVTAADVEIAYLHMVPTTANAAITLSAAANRAHIHHDSFDMFTAAASTSTRGVDVTGAASNVLIEQCLFLVAGAQGPAIASITAGLLDSLVQDCEFMLQSGVWARAVVTGAGVARTRIRRSSFSAAGTTATMTAGIDGSAADIAGGVFIEQNMFGASTAAGTGGGGVVLVPVDNYTATIAQLVENYRATMDITTISGGALVTLIN